MLLVSTFYCVVQIYTSGKLEIVAYVMYVAKINKQFFICF